VQAFEEMPEWVVCHQVTRSAAGVLVRCPTRGAVLSQDCLRCRFLTSSSVERTAGPWCEAAPLAILPAVEPPAEIARRAPGPRPRPWPLDLPVLVPVGPGVEAEPAVRPAEPVPSGQLIGT
jgi:hypothetical protein